MTSTIKVNNIKDTGDNNMVVKCGSTLTLGKSGDTVTLASGASQTGFGRTGTVDWQTSSIKTATFTAANGEGYFADTSSGAFTMNLPAGTAGNIVSVVDYTNTFQTNALTIAPNGSQKLGGFAAPVSLSTEGQSITLVYVDDTEGWKNIQDSTSNVVGNPNLEATGGSVTTSGDFKIHTFTGPGTFTVSNTSSTAANNIVSYMVVGGGGNGGGDYGGGGGAGGFREYKGPADSYTASPLNGNPGGTAVTITTQAYPITIGAGGTGSGQNTPGNPGSPSTFSTITSTGGGTGGTEGPNNAAGTGGSGGGAMYSQSGAAGNTPPVSPSQGNSGGNGGGSSAGYAGGGGGGAGSAGGAPGNASIAGAGGNGVATSITASPVTRAGGGGAAGGGSPYGQSYTPGAGGPGGGGAGATCASGAGTAGTANTGGGGGGGNLSGPSVGGNGGSGIVIIRYKFQN